LTWNKSNSKSFLRLKIKAINHKDKQLKAGSAKKWQKIVYRSAIVKKEDVTICKNQ
jgi:hypothetical protein